jgi:hypothetical protein
MQISKYIYRESKYRAKVDYRENEYSERQLQQIMQIPTSSSYARNRPVWSTTYRKNEYHGCKLQGSQFSTYFNDMCLCLIDQWGTENN